MDAPPTRIVDRTATRYAERRGTGARDPEHESRVARYAERVAAGRGLFEPGPAERGVGRNRWGWLDFYVETGADGVEAVHPIDGHLRGHDDPHRLLDDALKMETFSDTGNT